MCHNIVDFWIRRFCRCRGDLVALRLFYFGISCSIGRPWPDSPVWVRSCRRRLPFVLKRLGHMEQA